MYLNSDEWAKHVQEKKKKNEFWFDFNEEMKFSLGCSIVLILRIDSFVLFTKKNFFFLQFLGPNEIDIQNIHLIWCWTMRKDNFVLWWNESKSNQSNRQKCFRRNPKGNKKKGIKSAVAADPFNSNDLWLCDSIFIGIFHLDSLKFHFIA